MQKLPTDTERFLASLVNYEKRGLEGVGAESLDPGKLTGVLKKLNDPHLAYESVHVAGTKGKGSVCQFTSSILSSSGYRTGLYTSPHLLRVNERIRINSKEIEDGELADVISVIRERLEGAGDFTYFEVMTLAAMLHFARSGVDYAVFETGLGGRFDATNVLESSVCGITPVSYDHTHVLGKTLGEIAAEKAAIIKRASRCVSSPQQEEALSVIKKRCAEVGSPLTLAGEEITWRVREAGAEGSRFDLFTKWDEYTLCRTRMPGFFQVSNCATAAGICEELLGDNRDKEAFRRGIARAYVPGRMEILSKKPMVLIDGAQNGASARALAVSVRGLFPGRRVVLVLGICRDKEIKSVCDELMPLADEVVLTRATSERAADPEIIRGFIRRRSAMITRDVPEALGGAFKLAEESDLILVTGSFYVIAEVRDIILRDLACRK
ncbi:MAG: bifunctional folylpolyglutamate synthase/dihydrofolate synthase [Candidatus Omnitrophica bacterium]|nr:bifunctional folylpolyglutamate synthase/dihydrofolate synthase [Candidatus Omnitrophota bacterium]